MRRNFKIFFLLLIFPGSVSAQVLADSNLPVVIVNTDGGVPIPDNPRIKGSMKIINRGGGQRNYVSDQNNTAYLDYNGRIDIEIRGATSKYYPKTQYGFSTRMADGITNNNVSLLGMPPENDWILNGMGCDPALIRDYLCYNLSRMIGEYASRTAYCELIINGTYKGLYLLEEKIKADDNRVDIIKIGIKDNNLPELSGGYITKTDHITADDPLAWEMASRYGGTIVFIHELPKPENVTTAQNDYIYRQFIGIDATAQAGNASLSNGFPSIIDIPSFINYIILTEFFSNADAYQLSTFYHKDRNGKLRAGPLWDLDLTFGNDLFDRGVDRSKPYLWQLSENGSLFWHNLFNNTQFRCYLSKRYNELIQPDQPLNLTSIETFIDKTVATIHEAVIRDNALWGDDKTYQQRIAEIKTFIAERTQWMTANLGPYLSCADIPLPPLVISKIMYHPKPSTFSSDDEDLEFIEITNNGNGNVNLTGVYFGGTGFVYQFPINSSLEPYKSVLLASNPTLFKLEYGFAPDGQFTRHLSNKSENLILSDAFGNTIDNVTYSDSLPWPDADGNGNYLLLKDLNLDNDKGENWTVSDNKEMLSSNIFVNSEFQLFPNPVNDIVKIKAPFIIRSISIFDIYGHLLENMSINSEAYELDMKQYIKGLYILKINTQHKNLAVKIIRN